MSFGGVAFGQAQTNPYNPNKDLEAPSPPSDGISDLCWSPVANHVVATSWDGQALCWEASTYGCQPKAACRTEGPLLCGSFSQDGSGVFLGGTDGKVSLWDLASGSKREVGSHQAPVRHCAWLPGLNALVTGSWDRTLRYWDVRQPNPVCTCQLPERVYALDAKDRLLVVGMADRHIHAYTLSQPQTPYKALQSPLKHQTRCVACFPDQSGYLIGSVEGRVAVQHVEASLASKNFTFRCHREGQDIFAVNAASFHPTHGTFVTAGSDGSYNFWDKDSKQRLKALSKAAAPITAAKFNRDGALMAYAVSYDWSRGSQQHDPATAKNLVLVRPIQEGEVKARARAPTRR